MSTAIQIRNDHSEIENNLCSTVYVQIHAMSNPDNMVRGASLWMNSTLVTGLLLDNSYLIK